MRVALLLLTISAVCYGILPDIVDSGISHILGDNYGQGQTEQDPTFVEVEQLQEEKPEDGIQVGICNFFFFFVCMTNQFLTFLKWNELIVYNLMPMKLNTNFLRGILRSLNMHGIFHTCLKLTLPPG